MTFTELEEKEHVTETKGDQAAVLLRPLIIRDNTSIYIVYKYFFYEDMLKRTYRRNNWVD
jgi:hypothetical protein